MRKKWWIMISCLDCPSLTFLIVIFINLGKATKPNPTEKTNITPQPMASFMGHFILRVGLNLTKASNALPTFEKLQSRNTALLMISVRLIHRSHVKQSDDPDGC